MTTLFVHVKNFACFFYCRILRYRKKFVSLHHDTQSLYGELVKRGRCLRVACHFAKVLTITP